ncbi:hypothetical protein J8273_1701 [Carpediemonas membranifera]|uniref:Uncharacterized protein n=1 Tax=Carpediemonas membranifera TaxID=201153 RepID=A0A8J6E425_9EUKA|nr:hypothetical protein J8273_1701 [Carpediemonas membranifera]|eukprot:KAG9396683.1 hypothetical protein J8273_1701 [Carpediemonas membranifera]
MQGARGRLSLLAHDRAHDHANDETNDDDDSPVDDAGNEQDDRDDDAPGELDGKVDRARDDEANGDEADRGKNGGDAENAEETDTEGGDVEIGEVDRERLGAGLGRERIGDAEAEGLLHDGLGVVSEVNIAELDGGVVDIACRPVEDLLRSGRIHHSLEGDVVHGSHGLSGPIKLDSGSGNSQLAHRGKNVLTCGLHRNGAEHSGHEDHKDKKREGKRGPHGYGEKYMLLK